MRGVVFGTRREAEAAQRELDAGLRSRILPVGTYMIATEPLDAALGEALAGELLPSNHAVSDNQFILDYFRLSGDRRLLFGGKCTYTGRTPSNLKESMRADMCRVFPQLANVGIDHVWGGHIDITVARTPDFGRTGPVYWAQGYSGHGVNATHIAAEIVSDAICGVTEKFDLFDRIRHTRLPLSDLFGYSFGEPAAESLLFGVKDGAGYLRFPMPFV